MIRGTAELSARLYSGDRQRMRIRQEMLLGIGGVRVRALGYNPKAWHMNEGHSAFSYWNAFVRKSPPVLPSNKLPKKCKIAQSSQHTPVPPVTMLSLSRLLKILPGYWQELGISLEQLLELGNHQEAWGTAFNMTVLALRMSGQSNGVSELHGAVSRNMWQESGLKHLQNQPHHM